MGVSEPFPLRDTGRRWCHGPWLSPAGIGAGTTTRAPRIPSIRKRHGAELVLVGAGVEVARRVAPGHAERRAASNESVVTGRGASSKGMARAPVVGSSGAPPRALFVRLRNTLTPYRRRRRSWAASHGRARRWPPRSAMLVARASNTRTNRSRSTGQPRRSHSSAHSPRGECPRSPLQRRHAATSFSLHVGPPSRRGTTCSVVARTRPSNRRPHHTQVGPSHSRIRASRSLRPDWITVVKPPACRGRAVPTSPSGK